MTLDFAKTADDDTLIRTLKPMITGALWHDGSHWHIRTPNGTWIKANFNHYWRTLYLAGQQLPDTPYWARSRHRLGMSASARQVASQLAWDCMTHNWPDPR